jgi:hypothetical protein
MHGSVYGAVGKRAKEVAFPTVSVTFVCVLVLGYDATSVIGAAHIAITIYQLWCLLIESTTAVYMCLPTLIDTFINILLTNTTVHTQYIYFVLLCVIELAYVLFPIVYED